MNLQQAQQLIRELGGELGGGPDTYSLDENAQLNLSYQDQLPVHIRYHGRTLILSSVVASEVDLQDPGLFPNLMDYQFMGIRTFGCVLSWNSGSNSLLLSRQLHGDPKAKQLAHELNILLKASLQVQRELQPLINGELTLVQGPENSAVAPSLQPSQMMRV